MSAAFQPADPNDIARRRRNRWLRRLVAAEFLLVLTVVIGWLIWLAVATGQRDAARQRLGEAGAAASVAELAAPLKPVPAEVNPAVEYARAHALIDESAPAWKEWREYHPPAERRTAQEQAEFEAQQRRVVAANGPALAGVAAADATVRPAVAVTAGDFGVWSQTRGPLPANMIDVLLPHLNPTRDLAELLAADAAVADEQGDGTRVLQDAIRMIGMADAIDADGHSLVEHLSALGIRSLAADAVRRQAAAARGPASLRQTVIALLLDDAPSAAGYRQAMRGEATMQQTMLDDLAAGNNSFGLVLRPVLRRNQAQMADLMRPIIAAVDGATRLTTAKAAMPDMAWLDEPSKLDAFAALMLPTLDRPVEAEYRSRASLRLAAAALAARSYQLDHDGTPPPDLAALVPHYLPSVPIDPLSADAVIQYNPARRRLWSVGADGDDDNGVSQADLLRQDPTQSNRALRGRFDDVLLLQ